ncbi:MAG: hypothetical protein PHP06_05880 [Clostridia bacterium]|nr:hypothetical protein [Clostridia bacterium]
MSQKNSVHKAPEITAAGKDGKEDPDRIFKPMLKGAFSTRPDPDTGNYDEWGGGVF